MIKSLTLSGALFSAPLLMSTFPVHAFDLIPTRENSFQLGAGMGLLPDYIGDQEYQFVFTPAIKGAWSHDRFGTFAVGYGAHGGLSWSPFNFRYGELALVGSATPGRHDSDHGLFGSDYLKGMGKVEDTPELGLRGSAIVLPWLTLHSQMMWGVGNTGHQGAWGDLGLEASTYLSESLEGSFDVSSSWGSSDYMQSFYGVTSEQAKSSRFHRYSADAGIKDITLSAGLRYHFTPSMSLEGHVGMISLQGDAADSPIVRERNNLVSNLLFMYRF